MADKIIVSGYDADTGDPKNVELLSDAGKAIVMPLCVNGTTTTKTSTNTGTRTRLTFDPPIKAAVVSVRGGGASVDADEVALYCFDASTTGVADSWLDEANAAPRHQLSPNDGRRYHYFNGDTVTYVDILAVGTTPSLKVSVEGIS